MLTWYELGKVLRLMALEVNIEIEAIARSLYIHHMRQMYSTLTIRNECVR